MEIVLVKTLGVGAPSLAVSSLMLLISMTIHMFQFRLGDTDQFGPDFVRPPPYLIKSWGHYEISLFWIDGETVCQWECVTYTRWSTKYSRTRRCRVLHIIGGRVHVSLLPRLKKVTPGLGIPGATSGVSEVVVTQSAS